MHRFTTSALALVVLCGSALAQTSGHDPKSTAKPGDTAPMKLVVPANSAKPAAKDEKITLKVGDKAPSIIVDEWVKGESVKTFEKGKVYVVEFWATWCGPCIQSIPHLTELAEKHKEVTFMGIAASEHKEETGTDARLENLKKFVTKQGDKMNYHVAYDSDRKMGKPWMTASGQKGIPAAFIVDGEGKIAWIGHPMELDEKLDGVLKNTKPTKESTREAKKAKTKGEQPAAKAPEKKDKGKG